MGLGRSVGKAAQLARGSVYQIAEVDVPGLGEILRFSFVMAAKVLNVLRV